jgi:tRNA1Val (adenine37-N6)-methyltransferase
MRPWAAIGSVKSNLKSDLFELVGLTRDTFFEGRLIVFQPREGYRFSIDAVLLAAAVKPQAGQRILELGSGCGIISLILGLRHPDIHVSAIEIQSDLASAAARNVSENDMGDRIVVFHTDLRKLPDDQVLGPFDWVVSNPPFRRQASGRVNPNQQRALARHEIEVTMEQLLACAGRMLRTGGQFWTIYPADRAVDIIERMRDSAIEPKCIQTVHSQYDQDAKLLLVHGIKGGGPGLRIAAPLIVYGPEGRYSEAVQSMMKP